jgi:hypothetical protein
MLLAVAAAGCSAAGSATPSPMPSPSPTPPVAIDATAYVDAWCLALGRLMLGFGNPDTDAKSRAWKDFERAVEQRDAASLDARAATVLAHLEAARVANARTMGFAPGLPASVEFEAVLVGLESKVTTIRAARGDPVIVAQADASMQAVWPRFLTHLQVLNALADAKTISHAQMGGCAAAREPTPSG